MSRRSLEENHRDFVDQRQRGVQRDDGEEYSADGVDDLPVRRQPEVEGVHLRDRHEERVEGLHPELVEGALFLRAAKYERKGTPSTSSG